MPTNLPERRNSVELLPQTKFGRFANDVQRVLRGRPAKNISLVLVRLQLYNAPIDITHVRVSFLLLQRHSTSLRSRMDPTLIRWTQDFH